MDFARLTNKAKVMLGVAVVLALISLNMAYSAYHQYFLQKYLNQAHINFLSGSEHYDKASVQLDKAAELEPNNTSLLLMKGAISVHQKQYSKAAEIYQQIIDSIPKGSDAANAHIGLAVAEMYLAQKASGVDMGDSGGEKGDKKKKKVKKKKKKKKKKPNKSKVAEHLSKAATSLELASGKSGKSPDALMFQWILLTTLGEEAKAKAKFAEINSAFEAGGTANKSTLVAFFYQRARLLSKQGKYRGAIVNLRKTFRLNPHLEIIPQTLYMNLRDLLETGWTGEPKLVDKVDDIHYVEEILGLVKTKSYQKESLLGLDPYLYRIYNHLGLAYGRLALLASKQVSWQANLELNDKVMAKLKELKASSPVGFYKKAQECFTKSERNRRKAKGKINNVQEKLVQDAYKVQIDRFAAQKQTGDKRSSYRNIGGLFASIAQRRNIDSTLKKNAFNNSSFYYGLAGSIGACKNMAAAAIDADPLDPRPLINCALLMEKNKRKDDAIKQYQLALKQFEKNANHKYSAKMLEWKRKAQQRLNILRNQ